MKTYDPALLAAVDLSSLPFALNYCRLLLRDIPNDFGAFPVRGLSDEAIAVQLELGSVGEGDAKRYAPHRVAAQIVLANPEYVRSYSGGGFGEQYRTAEEIAAGILRQGAALEKLLPDSGGNSTVELGW